MFTKSLKRLFSTHSLVLSDGGSSTLPQLVAAAQKLGGKITIGVIGQETDSIAERAALIPGTNSVITIKSSTKLLSDNLATAVASLSKKLGASHVITSSSSFGKDVIPRVGVLLDVQPISDVIDIINEKTFKRPMYAGNVIATIESSDPVKVLTVRPTAFTADVSSHGCPCPGISDDSIEVSSSIATFVSEEVKKSDKPDLSSAKVVVSGGRALKSKENFEKLLNPLCEKLGAAVGASRAAVDAGYAANDLQVGQTGKIVAPDLYIAVGISGAIQHVAGMKDSRTIVAINKDKECPIFQIADYGIVGDLFEIVPELTKKL
jgi:electron transfer flavoprotein alpha subunit